LRSSINISGVSGSIAHGARQFTDRLLALCQRIKIAQMLILVILAKTSRRTSVSNPCGVFMF
jgi:hypothetical protein